MDENLIGKKVIIDYGSSSSNVHVEVTDFNSTYLVAEDTSGRIRIFPWTSINVVTISKGQK